MTNTMCIVTSCKMKCLSTHYLYHLSCRGLQRDWTWSQLTYGERQGTLWTGYQSSQLVDVQVFVCDKMPFRLFFFKTYSIKVLYAMHFLSCGSKEGGPRGNPCRHKDQSACGFESRTVELWGGSANLDILGLHLHVGLFKAKKLWLQQFWMPSSCYSDRHVVLLQDPHLLQTHGPSVKMSLNVSFIVIQHLETHCIVQLNTFKCTFMVKSISMSHCNLSFLAFYRLTAYIHYLSGSWNDNPPATQPFACFQFEHLVTCRHTAASDRQWDLCFCCSVTADMCLLFLEINPSCRGIL